MSRERDYLSDLLAYVERIEEFTQEGRTVFYHDEKTQYAVVRCYEIIGEIVKRLPEDRLSRYPEVPWRRVKGFRDYLAHHYDEVTIDIVWDAVEQLPVLRQAVEAMLSE
jgi:uncharacterized protein with HEPN domain